MDQPFVDIHCHLLPGIDDGSADAATSMAMAEMAVDDGISTIIVTPHQLGSYGHNRGDDIRRQTAEVAELLAQQNIPLTVLPGGDVRIEPDLVERIADGDVVTLGDHKKHVLLELPHELFMPFEPLLDRLASAGIVGVLSHPERNAGILREPNVLGSLVDRGCLMQVTAGSVIGAFGPASRQLAEWMLGEGLIHFVATDAHGLESRRPRLGPAFDRVAELTNAEIATDLCCRNPAAVAAGGDVGPGRRPGARRSHHAGRPRSGRKWWPWSRVS